MILIEKSMGPCQGAIVLLGSKIRGSLLLASDFLARAEFSYFPGKNIDIRLDTKYLLSAIL